jgi:hypothetical protein
MSFGHGFSQGFRNGIIIGEEFNKANKQHKLNKLRDQAIEEAKGLRESDIGALVEEGPGARAPIEERSVNAAAPQTTTPASVEAGSVMAAAGGIERRSLDAPVTTTPAAQGMATPGQAAATATPATETPQPVSAVPPASPAAQGVMGPTAPFSVKGRGYGTREEALKAAEQHIASLEDYQTNTIFKKKQQFYLENGEPEKAQQYANFLESKRGKDAIKTYSNAMQKLMFAGDVNGGIKELGDYYNRFIDDGVDFTGGKVGEDGKIIVTVKDKASGKSREVPFSKAEIMRMAFAYDPAKLVEMGMEQIRTEEKTAAELAKERRAEAAKVREENRGEARDIRKEGRARDAKIEDKTLDAQLEDAKPGTTGQQIRDLRRSGLFSEDEIKKIVATGEHKKTTDPTERRALVVDSLTKNVFGFANKPVEERNRMIDEMMASIYRDEKPASPATGGISEAPKGKGTPVYDTKTKSIVYR